MLSIDSLTFDLSNCSLKEQSENHRIWVNSIGVAHQLRFDLGPPDWAFDLTDSVAATQFYKEQCTGLGGAMLEMEVTTVAGAEALRGLFKYRAPIPDSLAVCYVGIVWLAFRECRFQINVEAMETGITGVREAFVVITEPDLRLNPPSNPRQDSQLGPAPICQWPSDHERYDNVFPDHPLSKVRKRITEVMATLELAASAKPLTPFRIRRGWRFWT